MNIETAQDLLQTYATKHLETDTYTINEFTTTTQCKWMDDDLERVVHLDTHAVHRPNFVTVAYSVWKDDYDTLERKRYEEDIAVLNPNYDEILTTALNTAFTKVQTIEDTDLEVIDHLEPQ